jgi:hypothetical protein
MTVAAIAATSSMAIFCNDRVGGSASAIGRGKRAGVPRVERGEARQAINVAQAAADAGVAHLVGLACRDAHLVPAREELVDHRQQPPGGARGKDHQTAPFSSRERKRRRRSALVTTEMLENTIARLAITGFSRPMAASGTAARL